MDLPSPNELALYGAIAVGALLVVLFFFSPRSEPHPLFAWLFHVLRTSVFGPTDLRFRHRTLRECMAAERERRAQIDSLLHEAAGGRRTDRAFLEVPPAYDADRDTSSRRVLAAAGIGEEMQRVTRAAKSIEISVTIPLADSEDGGVSLQLSMAGMIGQQIRLRAEMEEMERRLAARVVDACLWLHLEKYFSLRKSNPDLRLRDVPLFFDRIHFVNERADTLLAKTLGRLLFPGIYPGRVVIETEFPEEFVARFGNEGDRSWFGCGIELRSPAVETPVTQGVSQCRTAHDRQRARVDGGVTINYSDASGRHIQEEFFLTCDHNVSPGCPSRAWSAEPDWTGNCPDFALLRPENRCGPKQNSCTDAFDRRRSRVPAPVSLVALNEAAGRKVYLWHKGRRHTGVVGGTVREGTYRYRRSDGSYGIVRFPHLEVDGPFFSRESDSGGWVMSVEDDGFAGLVTHGPREGSGGGYTRVHSAERLVSYLNEFIDRSPENFRLPKQVDAARGTVTLEFWQVR